MAVLGSLYFFRVTSNDDIISFFGDNYMWNVSLKKLYIVYNESRDEL